ncbi:MAG: ABC-three component system middle component 6 [Candidatus Methanoperedens sp.]
MLLPDNVHPEQSIYFNGSFVLQALQKDSKQKLLDLYQNVKQQRNITFPVFILCLDWLFLINLAELNDNGEVELCS